MTEAEDVSQHPILLAELSNGYPNSIMVMESSVPLREYKCVMHVCQFAENENYALCTDRGVYAGASFAQWLLDSGNLKENADVDAVEGDFIFYFADGQFIHVGIVAHTGRVVSKWGKGHLYEHDIWEVPESYGEEIRVFSPLSANDAYYFFTQYAEENGIKFKGSIP